MTIRRDSNADGVADASDAVVSGATVTVEVRNSVGSLVGTLSGITDAAGLFTSSYLMDLPDETYTADVTSLTHDTFTWNALLDVEADETHTVPHSASSSLLALAFENSTGDTSSSDSGLGETSPLFVEETAEVDYAPPTGNRRPRAHAVDSVMTLLGRESGSAEDTSFAFDGIGDDLLEDLVVAQL
ncbi:MAG: hypothetical protein IH899_14380 [Planctomycetes bacterium]|nr:hypothetical protein [Planctomycetota bacterium]